MKVRRIAVAVAVLGVLSVAAGAQTEASEFQLSGDYDLQVGDTIDRGARLYQSRSLGAVLVVSDAVSVPLLLLPGTGNVQEVPLMRLVPRSGGGVGLLKGDALRTIGKFKITSDAISFSHSGLSLALKAKEPVVGLTSREDLFEHSPGYRTLADAYTPDSDLIAKLKGVGEGYRVRVVFGSWCHVCKNFLPRGLKLQEALAGSVIRFEYFGLPTGPWEPPHPEVRRLEVKSLPTAIVFKGDEEIGRFAGGEEWQSPEARLWRAIERAQ